MSSETSILKRIPVVLIESPSLISSALSRRMIETVSSSKFKTTPLEPLLNSTSSDIIALESPEATITPSVFLRTTPTFLAVVSILKPDSFFSNCLIISSEFFIYSSAIYDTKFFRLFLTLKS